MRQKKKNSRGNDENATQEKGFNLIGDNKR